MSATFRTTSMGTGTGRWMAWLIAAPMLLVIAALAMAWAQPQADIWTHLRAYVLFDVIFNSLWLMLNVAVGVSVLGVGLAWLSAHCDYPGRRFLDWALVLPLAMPTYVVAFAWIGVLDYSAPLQTGWRALSGSRVALFDGRGILGASVLLSLVLYPYVYVLARSAFLRQGAAGFDAARCLGHGPASAFFRVALPLIRPAWMAGLSLALLETLADFGAVSILGVDTFTTAIYKTWFGLFSLPAAAQLATALLLAVAMVLVLERYLRGNALRREANVRPQPRLRLSGWRGWLASASAWLLVAFGFGLPVLQLLSWLDRSALDVSNLMVATLNTLLLGVGVAVLVLILGGGMALLTYARPGDGVRKSAEFVATLGYAIPGTVLAVAVMGLLIAAQHWGSEYLDMQWALVGSTLGVVIALCVRFLRVGHGAVQAGLTQLRPSAMESARLLGAGPLQRWRQIALPQLRPSLLAALLLVLVETMKEMPATLMLRPFGWDTLAVRIYAQTAEGLWAQAAAPGLLLVAAGLLPVWWLVRAQR
ncbi:MAG: ABC transporter permease [Pseudomarimonas sp.]